MMPLSWTSIKQRQQEKLNWKLYQTKNGNFETLKKRNRMGNLKTDQNMPVPWLNCWFEKMIQLFCWTSFLQDKMLTRKIFKQNFNFKIRFLFKLVDFSWNFFLAVSLQYNLFCEIQAQILSQKQINFFSQSKVTPKLPSEALTKYIKVSLLRSIRKLKRWRPSCLRDRMLEIKFSLLSANQN